jgi:wyosine [tRNA(Phe)-imidazoG37] synthetase (radical SAM superfamily)
MKYLFGPVKSRRFGVSLGIDLSPEIKSCNFDCLYCELEKSKPTNKIQKEGTVKEILNEVKSFLSKNPYPDVITITSNGEPTLYSKLDKLITEINRIKGTSKTLILSNASTITKPEIRETLKKFDIVKLSLDSTDQKTFEKVDRPLKNIKVDEIVKGLKEFRKTYKGMLVIEILVVKHVNDSEENIKHLAEILKDINPDRVDLGTIDRPPAYRVKPVSNKELYHLASFLNGLNVAVVQRKDSETPKFSLSKEEIIKTLSTRPFSEEDIKSIFDEKTKQEFENLLKSKKIKEKQVGNLKFYSVNS